MLDLNRCFLLLKAIKIDYRDRRIIYELYKEQETIVEVGEEKGRAKIRQGVRQGCPLSPIIFNIFIEGAIHKIIEKEKGGVKINGQKVFFIRFADDIAAIAENPVQLQDLMNEMDKTFEDFGMKINVGKTKTLATSKFPVINSPIKIKDKKVEQVNSFKYLGSIITSDSRCTPDIKARIAMAKTAFNNISIKLLKIDVDEF